jgi:DNA-directed RNA polymerase specialized sigma24 family protein
MTLELTAFEGLQTSLRPKVVSYLRRYVGPEEAEDLTQEVFLKVHGSLEGFRGEAKVATRVFQIATHVALDHLKSRSHRLAQALLPETALEHAVSASVPAPPRSGCIAPVACCAAAWSRTAGSCWMSGRNCSVTGGGFLGLRC